MKQEVFKYKIVYVLQTMITTKQALLYNQIHMYLDSLSSINLSDYFLVEAETSMVKS